MNFSPKLQRSAIGTTVLALGFLGLTSVPASAATLDVCETSCTYSSVAAAVAAAAPGDTVDIAAGTYNEQGIKIDKPITIKGAGPGQTILDGGSAVVSGGSGLFNIRPEAASYGTGDIVIEGLTIQNPNRAGASSTFFGIYIGIKRATTGIEQIVLDNLEIFSFASGGSYGIYADTGAPIGGEERQVPALTVKNSLIKQQNYNAIGLDGWNAPVSILDNELHRGSGGVSAILVSNGYVTERVDGPLLVDGNTGFGRLIWVRNDTKPAAPGYDNITITNNTVSGLDFPASGNNPAFFIGSYFAQGGTDGAMQNVVISKNTVSADGSVPGAMGAWIYGNVSDVQITENDFTGLGTGVIASNDGSAAPQGLVANNNRLFANTVGLNNASDGDIEANDNWWGCQDGPVSGDLTHCSPVTNAGGGSVDVSTWRVAKATAAKYDPEVGEDVDVTVDFTELNTGAAAPTSSVFDALAVTWTVDKGSLADLTGVLSAAGDHETVYTAPDDSVFLGAAARGDSTVNPADVASAPPATVTDTVTAAIDRVTLASGDVTGEPVEIVFEVAKASDNDGDDGDEGDDTDDTDLDGDSDEKEGTDDTSVLPDTGAPASSTPVALGGFAALLLGAGALALRRRLG